MAYYIDGDFKDNLLPKPEQACYSSSYSSANSAYQQILLKPEEQKLINEQAFDEVVGFYNENEDLFQTFAKENGVDVWFFEQFRMYFAYRTFFLRLACIRQFLVENETGIVITSDQTLKAFIAVDRLQFVPTEKRAKANKKKMLGELFTMLKKTKFKHKQQHENLILSRIEDDREGKDQRFGAIELKCDKIFNRESFNPNKAHKLEASVYNANPNVDQLMGDYFFGAKWLLDLRKFRKSFKTLSTNLSNKTEGNAKIILSLFRQNEMSFYIYYLRYRAFCGFFKKTNYKGILFINENSAQQKAIQFAASQHNVKVYGIQHGAIYDLHPAYMFGKYKHPPILPNITFTWGNYFTQLLIDKGGYQKAQVITAGRLEPININRKQNAAIQKDKKVIVYATQPQPDTNLRKRELRDVFAVTKQFTANYQLVLRPHPAELSDQFFLDLANEVGFNNLLIDRESDLQTHFEVASLLITSYSTVGAEFIPFNKPLLVLDYLDADLVNYIKQGVGIPVRSLDNLVEILGKEKLDIDQDAYDKFVANYFYEKGEKAVGIVLDVLNSD
ncbi:MAG: hypothetical protein GQ574_26910 [Crocinitomix sp.]|nr:hypothetical protein [Crocinitomix sp.]